jgi:hypothetical protein
MYQATWHETSSVRGWLAEPHTAASASLPPPRRLPWAHKMSQMLTKEELAANSLLLDEGIRRALDAHWEAEERHPRRFGLDCFEENQARARALHETRRRVMAEVRDNRPAGVQPPDSVVFLGDLLAEAAGQICHEIESAQPARLMAISRKLYAWEDARQCAEDLGIRPCQGHEQALRELERVGLAWTVEAARRPQNGPRD